MYYFITKNLRAYLSLTFVATCDPKGDKSTAIVSKIAIYSASFMPKCCVHIPLKSAHTLTGKLYIVIFTLPDYRKV